MAAARIRKLQISSEILVSAGTSGTTDPMTVTAGSLLTITISSLDGSEPDFTVTDDQSNTWALGVENHISGGNKSYIGHCLAPAAGATEITVTADMTCDFVAVVEEWASDPVASSWGLDIYSSIDETSATTSHVNSADASVIDVTAPALVVTASVTDPPATSDVTHVQTSSEISVSSGTSGPATLTGVATGNLLVVQVVNLGETPITFSVTDDQSNDWYPIISENGPTTDNGSAILACFSAAGGDTEVTVTADSATDFIAIVHEVEGNPGGLFELDDYSSLVETGIATTSHFCSASSSEIDTTDAAIVFCAAAADAPSSTGFGTVTEGTGYTPFIPSDPRAYFQYKIFGSSTANERGAFGSSVGRRAANCIAAFKCPAVAPGDFGKVIPGEYYFEIPASTDRVFWQYRIFSADTNDHRGPFTSEETVRSAGVIASYVPNVPGCNWWPCCSGGGSGTPEPCTVRKLDEDGVEVWRYLPSKTPTNAVRVDRDSGDVFIRTGVAGTGLSDIKRLDQTDGSVVWSIATAFGTGGAGEAMAIVPADDRLYSGASAFDLSGSLQWTSLSMISAFDLAATSGGLRTIDGATGPVDWWNTSDGSSAGISASHANIRNPGIYHDSGGDVWVNAFYYLAPSKDLQKRLSSDGSLDTTLSLTTSIVTLTGFVIDPSDNFIIVGSGSSGPGIGLDYPNYFAMFDSSGAQQWEVMIVTNASYFFKCCVNHSTGDCFVVIGTIVQKYNSSGVLQWEFDHTALIRSLDCDDDGNVYIGGDEAGD